MKLQAISDKDNVVQALRNGKLQEIHHNLIQVGEVIQINSGMQVPVDGIVIKAMGVLTNESAMTGEPDEMKKEALDQCKMKQEDKDAEYAMMKNPVKQHHDLPSPLILSGT
jgi:P-type E1-E2 ATPase